MSAKQKSDILYALRWAFPYTVPIFMGFWFIGLAYGIYMNVMGFGFLYPFFMSHLIFGGSLEFIVVPMLLAPFAPLQMILVALLIVYCLKDVSFLTGFHGIPEAIAIAATIAVHVWRRNLFFSCVAGTAIYMILIHLI